MQPSTIVIIFFILTTIIFLIVFIVYYKKYSNYICPIQNTTCPTCSSPTPCNCPTCETCPTCPSCVNDCTKCSFTNIDPTQRTFTKYPNATLNGWTNQNITNTTEDKCLATCKSDASCTGLTFNTSTNACAIKSIPFARIPAPTNANQTGNNSYVLDTPWK